MRSVYLGLPIFLLLLPLASGAAAQKPDTSFTGRVLSVADGDTYDVRRLSGDTLRIRLWGIDAPELGQPYGSASAEAARTLLRDRSVRVVLKGKGPQGRPLARLEVQGRSLAEKLVSSGFAWHNEQNASAQRIKRLEGKAEEAGRGLWSQPQPVPPWEWRARRRRGPSGTDRSCSDFSTQSEAQRFFVRQQPGDPHRLDKDGDGRACEGLPTSRKR